MSHPTLRDLATELAAGRTSSRELAEACLARIADPVGEGARAFSHVDAPRVLAAADGYDRLRAAGAAPSPYAGIPLSVKDLFDVAGEVTRAGSVVLSDRPPAESDAPAVARLRRAGFLFVGRTTMTEFAYSGLGLNPHFGTPGNALDRTHVPGGSTSGGAISVADGMAHVALGSDTGGSIRIPAAFNRVVGFKPTARRVPLGGMVPLSASLDSIGPIARSVACVAAVDALLADAPEAVLPELPLAGLRFAVPRTICLDDLDTAVAAAFEAMLSQLAGAGARITEIDVPEFAEVSERLAGGGVAAAEAWAYHRSQLAIAADRYDPRVAERIFKGRDIDAAEYIDLLAWRQSFIVRVGARFVGFDALLAPTVAILPPRIADLADAGLFATANRMALRNTGLINLMDGCAISLPIGSDGAPVGLMISAGPTCDRTLLAVAASVEACLATGRSIV